MTSLLRKSLPGWLTFVLTLTTYAAVAQYQMNGNAAQTSCNCYRLTPASNSQNGSVWNVNLFDLSNPFNFTFDVFLGCSDGGADGLAFVLQPLSVNAGSFGGGIGYQGISPSFAIEMDTYVNATDPGYDHMAFQTNGVVSHGGPNTLAGPVQTSASNANVEDCAWHQLNVVWDPVTQTMTAYFDGVLRLTYTGNLVANIFGGNPNVYWGFTAATGGANNLHQFCNTLSPAFIITSPVQCVGFPVDFESSSVVATGLITNHQWDFGDGNTTTGTQVSHTYATAGTYTVTLTITSEGCTASNTVQVTINPSPSFNLGTDQSLCVGQSYQISPTGLTGGEQLTWNPVVGLSNPGVSNPNATPATTTTYTLSVVDANGCSNTDDIVITINPLPVANAGPDQTICEGVTTSMSATGGAQYSWNPTTGLLNASSATTQANPITTTNYTLTVTDANGCQDTDGMTITVNPTPNVTAGTDASICNTQNTQLNAAGASTYSWSPTTGLSNSTIANPIFNGSNTTTFIVTGTDSNGCQSTDDVTVTVFPLPVANFAQPAPVCLGNPSEFTDNSNGTGLNYSWNFGDGSPVSTAVSPNHIYAAAGNYTVTLSLTDANGCQATSTSTASVFPLPTAAINISDGQEFCEDQLINFVSQSVGGNLSYLWDFGDNAFLPAFPNTTSTLQNPTFGYPNFAFSPFTVRLGVTDAAGCYDQVQTIVVIRDNPVADFSAPNVCEGSSMSFTDESTVNASTISTWNWNFGDGTGTSSSQNPNYQFVQDGIYQVQLNVQTQYGCTASVTEDVVVSPTPTISIAGNDTCLNDLTTFVNNSSPQDATVNSWDWDLGDGSVASGASTSHTYTSNGQYVVTLTATTDSGCVATGSTQIEVFPNPVPAFAMFDAEGCTPHNVLFVNQSSIASGLNSTYIWDLGDGSTSTSSSPQHTYADSGYYDISLSVTSDKGCNTAILLNDAVRANITPVADFGIQKEVLSLLNAEAVLTDQSLHAITWNWNLGDGTTSSLPNPSHIYSDPGTYHLILTVTNGDCEDVAFGQIRVDPIVTFYIPSAFTPDDDGINETFFGVGESIKTYNMKISNRWGELLFESNSPDFHWDGKHKGKPVESGVYIYEFNLVDTYEEGHRYTGSVRLLR